MAQVGKEKETILIEYDDCIRCLSFGVLKFLIKNKDFYSKCIDFKRFEHLDDKNLLRFSLQRLRKNIIEVVMLDDARDKYNCDDILQGIYKRESIYTYEQARLSLYELLPVFINMPEIERVIIFSEHDSINIPAEIMVSMENMLMGNNVKITYMSGDYYKVIEENRIDSVILSNLELAVNTDKDIIRDVGIAKLPYNMSIENEQLVFHPFVMHMNEEMGYEFKYVGVIKLSPEHFSMG